MEIIITGMHRSGTSAVARAINLFGCYFAPAKSPVILAAKAENPKGFWERTDVIQLNEEIVRAGGAEWDNPSQFRAESIPHTEMREIDGRIANLLAEMREHPHWFLKDPRFCLTLPVWRRQLRFPVIVHVWRHAWETARSYSRRGEFPFSTSLALWEYHVCQLVRASQGLPVVHVCYSDLLADPVSFAADLQAALESASGDVLPQFDRSALADFVSPDLHRHRARETSGQLSDAQGHLMDWLAARRMGEQSVTSSPILSEEAAFELEVFHGRTFNEHVLRKCNATRDVDGRHREIIHRFLGLESNATQDTDLGYREIIHRFLALKMRNIELGGILRLALEEFARMEGGISPLPARFRVAWRILFRGLTSNQVKAISRFRKLKEKKTPSFQEDPPAAE